MCAWCNACLNGLVSYCEKFICDAEACKFWTLQESNPKGDPEVVWWCHCPSQFFVSQHAPCLMLGWLCFWPWSLAWAIVGASRMYDLGQFLVHLTDADTNSPGGCAIISVSPDIYFFFLSCSGFLPTLPSLLSYPPPSIPYFYFPLLILKAPKPGIDCPLTHEFNSSGGESPEWMSMDMGQGRVGGLRVHPQPRVLDWGHSLRDITATVVIGGELCTFLPSCFCALLCVLVSDETKVQTKVQGWEFWVGGNRDVKCKADVGLVCLPPTLPAECPGGGPETNSALDKRTRVWAQSCAGLWDFFLNNSSIYTLGYSSHMWLMALFSNLEEVSQRTMCFCRQMSKMADRWGMVR